LVTALGSGVLNLKLSFLGGRSVAAFITQLQAELNGTILVTGMTAVGQYTASTFSFGATSITTFLNN
jgi:hypothetical protein